jgi:UDP-2,4-diacetamido-2,4,6-trideoxy-beta-L-altropyranose hydrolase
MEGARVIVRVDASPRMGGGHAMRCLTLADALAARGAHVTFVAATMLPGLADRIREGGHRLAPISSILSATTEGVDWDSQILSPDAQSLDAKATQAAVGPADLTIVDHYRLDAEWEAEAPGKLLVIDDLANRRHDCDVLLDQTFGTTTQSYTALVNEKCTLLIGATYALLRPEFKAMRPAALRRRRDAATIKRILISLGSTDVDGITERVVTTLLSAGVDCALDVVVPSSAQSLPALRARAALDPRISIHVDSDAMAELMLHADLAIGAAGTTTWERCCVGLPTIALVLADNQRGIAYQLSQVQAAIFAATPQDAALHTLTLMRDPVMLQRMIAATAAIVDGDGTQRVVEAVLQPEVPMHDLHLRRAEAKDSERLWLWRNDPSSRAMAKTSTPITWPEHSRWFGAILSDPTTELLIAEYNAAPVAMVRFDHIDEGEALVSINVAPACRGKGVGRAALSAACDRHLAKNRSITLRADIHVTNAASLRIFTPVGFAVMETTGEFHRLTLVRSEQG